MLFIDRGDIQWQYPNRVGNIEKCRTFCCRLTLPNRDFNETWHLHTCRQHQSTYLHSTDTRNKWMKELNNFYGKNHSKGKKKNEGGRTPFSAHLTVHFLCRWKLFPLFVIHNRPLQVFRVPLATLLSIWIFSFPPNHLETIFFLCCPLLIAVPHSENFSII